ncbi:vault protein inter-alpha-trypsin domain-containing protein [Melanogaster broomeanus]|nr:vault protein inter-alpha-trypsin domain-containing protein [Melanogaster broomeanus]
MASTRAGIVHQQPGQATIGYLPLEEVKVKAWVVDVSARIVITQTFQNPSGSPTGRAKYLFPLPANAAVCAFDLEFEDGRMLVGEVKEKETAAQAFTDAVEGGRKAGLVERVTDDIFTISVGSIPASSKVTAHLTFVMDLLDEAIRDHVRLQLPMSIGERYGTPPPAIHDASAVDSRTRVHINVDIQTSDVIYDIRSPTHPISLLRYKTRSGRKSQRRMSVLWQSSEFLKDAFVITIHAEGLDKPRCFAEVLTEMGNGDTGRERTVAMQLTLVPEFQAPKIPSQEYIFVIDRSGSMGGSPMETAKRTLAMLLRLLPSSQTTFNIFSFGSHVTGFRPRSIMLDQQALNEAVCIFLHCDINRIDVVLQTSHVQAMEANYGGTETPGALKAAFVSRGLDRPAVVFLLTDGQIHLDPNTLVSTAVRNSPPQAPLRLFVLGIGTQVSSDICSSLARMGNGEYLLALSAENITGKCARLLNAGRSKNIERIDIVWGNNLSSPSSPQVSFTPGFTPTPPAPTPDLAPPPPIQQAPHTLTKIFSGIRFTVFAITTFRSIPTSVRLITKLEGVNEPLEFNVDVMETKPFKSTDDDSVVPLIHSLAARGLITELDEGRGPTPTAAPGGALLFSEDELRKAGIIKLGLEYQLVSRYTSFVAIEKGDELARGRGRDRRSRAWIRSRLPQENRDPQDPPRGGPTFFDSVLDDLALIVKSVFNFFGAPVPPTNASPSSQSHHQSIVPGAYVRSESSLSRDRRRDHHQRRGRSVSSRYSADTFSTLSSLEGSSESSYWSPSRSPSPRPRFRDPIERVPSPEFIQDENARAANPPPAVPQTAYDLFLLQRVDGSFTPSPALNQIVGDEMLGKAEELGVDKTVWATAVAVAYLKKHLEGEPDLFDALLAKAQQFAEALGKSGGAREFEELVRKAFGLLSSQTP